MRGKRHRRCAQQLRVSAIALRSSGMARVRLRRGHVQPVWAGHPWIYAQAIDGIEGAPAEGDPVDVVDPNGNFIGAGFYSPRSAIPVRIMSRTPGEKLDGAAIGRRLDAA